MQDPEPSVAASALVLLNELDPQRGKACSACLRGPSTPAWVGRTVDQLLALSSPAALADLPDLEKRVVLATSDFFRRTWADTIDLLADQSEIRLYEPGATITEAGDTCRELLLLIEGAALVEVLGEEGMRVSRMQPGQVLDELEVLSHCTTERQSWRRPAALAFLPCRSTASTPRWSMIKTSLAAFWPWKLVSCNGSRATPPSSPPEDRQAGELHGPSPAIPRQAAEINSPITPLLCCPGESI